jgi:hypothetical protein
VVGGGAVPVPLVGRRVDDVASADLLDGAAAGLYQPLAVGHVEGLADGVGVPRGAGAGVNRTALTRTREGSSPRAIASMKTSPENHSAGPLAVGGLGWMGTGGSLPGVVGVQAYRRSWGLRWVTGLLIAAGVTLSPNATAATPRLIAR